MRTQIQATTNYEQIHDAYINGQRGIVLPGGTRSTKTVSALQWILIYCLQNTGKELAVTRDTMANLKRTVLKDFEALCYGHGDYAPLYPGLRINKSDWTCNINGNNISFFGLKDDPMRAHGFRSDIFFINEAVSTYRPTFDQLEQRCEEFWILDCNPSEPQSWVYLLDSRPDVTFFRSTYKDNPFLGQKIIDKIEGYEPTEQNRERGTANERMWSIYGQGLIFKGKEIIFPDWKMFSEDPGDYDYCFYGLDFGWNDPLVASKIIVNGNDLYTREIIYASGIETTDAIEILMGEPLLKEQETYLVCDSAEPRTINELIKGGLPAMGVKKGAGSIVQGLRKMQGMNLYIHEDSINTQKEANNYKWKVDPKTEDVLDIPVDKYNHAFDSIRYPLITFL